MSKPKESDRTYSEEEVVRIAYEYGVAFGAMAVNKVLEYLKIAELDVRKDEEMFTENLEAIREEYRTNVPEGLRKKLKAEIIKNIHKENLSDEELAGIEKMVKKGLNRFL